MKRVYEIICTVVGWIFFWPLLLHADKNPIEVTGAEMLGAVMIDLLWLGLIAIAITHLGG